MTQREEDNQRWLAKRVKVISTMLVPVGSYGSAYWLVTMLGGSIGSLTGTIVIGTGFTLAGVLSIWTSFTSNEEQGGVTEKEYTKLIGDGTMPEDTREYWGNYGGITGRWEATGEVFNGPGVGERRVDNDQMDAWGDYIEQEPTPETPDEVMGEDIVVTMYEHARQEESRRERFRMLSEWEEESRRERYRVLSEWEGREQKDLIIAEMRNAPTNYGGAPEQQEVTMEGINNDLAYFEVDDEPGGIRQTSEATVSIGYADVHIPWGESQSTVMEPFNEDAPTLDFGGTSLVATTGGQVSNEEGTYENSVYRRYMGSSITDDLDDVAPHTFTRGYRNRRIPQTSGVEDYEAGYNNMVHEMEESLKQLRRHQERGEVVERDADGTYASTSMQEEMGAPEEKRRIEILENDCEELGGRLQKVATLLMRYTKDTVDTYNKLVYEDVVDIIGKVWNTHWETKYRGMYRAYGAIMRMLMGELESYVVVTGSIPKPMQTRAEYILQLFVEDTRYEYSMETAKSRGDFSDQDYLYDYYRQSKVEEPEPIVTYKPHWETLVWSADLYNLEVNIEEGIGGVTDSAKE